MLSRLNELLKPSGWFDPAMVDHQALTKRLGRLGDGRMREICAALGVAVDCSP